MIMIVNDDALVGSQLAEALHAAGHEDIASCNVTQAYEQTAQSRPGLIVIVIKHRGTEGFMLAAALRIRERTSMIPIIVLSPHEEHRPLQTMLSRFGIKALLGEPFGTPDIIDLIDKATGSNGKTEQSLRKRTEQTTDSASDWQSSLEMDNAAFGE